jgi:hypothetical protein
VSREDVGVFPVTPEAGTVKSEPGLGVIVKNSGENG